MATREDFLTDPNVIAFIAWLGENAERVGIFLNVKASSKVPGGIINQPVVGISNAVTHYRWSVPSPDDQLQVQPGGRWASTVLILRHLSESLLEAVNSEDEAAVRRVCKQILKWGGNRSWTNGGWPFLNGTADNSPRSICQYLEACAEQLVLATADLERLDSILKMNSMLTKVHALFATDGLPIYDSRVAAAIAALTEIYRRYARDAPIAGLSDYLKFPYVDPSRSVDAVFSNSPTQGSVAERDDVATLAWTNAKIRLAWIMETVLVAQDSNVLLRWQGNDNPTVRDRMHAFEAGLFMIGYDISCLSNWNAQQPPIVINTERKVRKIVRTQAGNFQTTGLKQARTLGQHKVFQYSGDVESGVRVIHTAVTTWLSVEFLSAAIEVIESTSDGMRGGFDRKNPPFGSLGHWVRHESRGLNGYSLTPQNASFLAAILVAEGLIQSEKRRGAIYLKCV